MNSVCSFYNEGSIGLYNKQKNDKVHQYNLKKISHRKNKYLDAPVSNNYSKYYKNKMMSPYFFQSQSSNDYSNSNRENKNYSNFRNKSNEFNNTKKNSSCINNSNFDKTQYSVSSSPYNFNTINNKNIISNKELFKKLASFSGNANVNKPSNTNANNANNNTNTNAVGNYKININKINSGVINIDDANSNINKYNYNDSVFNKKENEPHTAYGGYISNNNMNSQSRRNKINNNSNRKSNDTNSNSNILNTSANKNNNKTDNQYMFNNASKFTKQRLFNSKNPNMNLMSHYIINENNKFMSLKMQEVQYQHFKNISNLFKHLKNNPLSKSPLHSIKQHSSEFNRKAFQKQVEIDNNRLYSKLNKLTPFMDAKKTDNDFKKTIDLISKMKKIKSDDKSKKVLGLTCLTFNNSNNMNKRSINSYDYNNNDNKNNKDNKDNKDRYISFAEGNTISTIKSSNKHNINNFNFNSNSNDYETNTYLPSISNINTNSSIKKNNSNIKNIKFNKH